MELFGRISHIKGDFFTVFGAKTGKEYKCKYRKLPIALSDSIYAKVEQKDGYYKIISYPWVEISNDPDVVETFFDFFKLNGAAIYKALLDKYKTVPELISNIDELASAPSDPKFSFPHTSPKMTLFFLKRWKTERNIRQLKLYGLSEVEIYTFSKYAVKTIPEMIKICRIDPLKFFNIKDEVVQHLCQVFQVVPTFVLVESRKLAKKCYEALLKSQSYLPFTGNVTDINDGVR